MDERSRKASLEVLTESARERVLQRAIEIDAARGTPVADLRAAAAEAGISPQAFDQAMAELDDESAPVAPPRLGSRLRTTWLAVSGVLALMVVAFVVLRLLAPVRDVRAVSVEQSFVLRCLSPQDAAQLLRPVLGETGTVESRGETSGIITVRGTGAQVEEARALLDRQDAACAVRPAP